MAAVAPQYPRAHAGPGADAPASRPAAAIAKAHTQPGARPRGGAGARRAAAHDLRRAVGEREPAGRDPPTRSGTCRRRRDVAGGLREGEVERRDRALEVRRAARAWGDRSADPATGDSQPRDRDRDRSGGDLRDLEPTPPVVEHWRRRDEGVERLAEPRDHGYRPTTDSAGRRARSGPEEPQLEVAGATCRDPCAVEHGACGRVDLEPADRRRLAIGIAGLRVPDPQPHRRTRAGLLRGELKVDRGRLAARGERCGCQESGRERPEKEPQRSRLHWSVHCTSTPY